MAKYHCKVVIKEWDADHGFDIPLKDFLAELGEILSSESGDVYVKFYQSGDSWDGYSMAEFKVYRHETDEEADAREAVAAVYRDRQMAEQIAREKALLQALKIKYSEGS